MNGSNRDIEAVAELNEVRLADLAVAVKVEGSRWARVERVAEIYEIGLTDDAVAIGVAEQAEEFVGGVASKNVVVATGAVAIAIQAVAGNSSGLHRQRISAIG